jgi:hypothetical protein
MSDEHYIVFLHVYLSPSVTPEMERLEWHTVQVVEANKTVHGQLLIDELRAVLDKHKVGI